MYITIGKNKKRYYPDEWQFTAYQFLNIHIDDPNMKYEPFCIKDNQEIKLLNVDRNGKKLSHWLLPYDDYIKPTAGEVYIGYNTNAGQRRERIFILPSILSSKELIGMAKTIGDVVFNNHSFTRANFSQQTNQGVNNGGDIRGVNLQKQGGYSDYILNQLPSLFDALECNISIIEESPALSMRAIKKEIQIHKSNNPKDLLARKLQPNKKITLSYGKSYDDYSPENKWLGYVIFEMLPRLLGNLKNHQQYQEDNSFDGQINEKLTACIEQLKNRLDNIQSNKFIKKFDLKINKAPQITTRLIKSKGYGEIVRVYQEIFNENFLKAFEFYNDVITAYSSGYLDNLSNIYEHWCLVVLYDNLLKLGFEPDDNSRLEKIITLQDGNLIIPSESVFVFRKPFAQYDDYNRSDIVIKLHYEPKLFFNHQAMLQDSQNYYDYLTPDIYIEINAPQRIYGLRNFSLILDAKFKNYNNLDLNYLLNINNSLKDIKYFQDIMYTAMYKYHYRLNDFFVRDSNIPKLRVGMSAILSPNVNFLWQGERPLIDCEFLQSNRNQVAQLFENSNVLNNNIYKGWVAHKFGTLTLRPKELGRDIRRLFAIIFYYHMGLTSLCLCCGRELHEEDEFFVNTDERHNSSDIGKTKTQKESENGYYFNNKNPDTRFLAKCKECETQWRISFCNGEDDNGENIENIHSHRPSTENRIIKLGIDDETGYIPIHHKTNEGTYCPKCFAMKKSGHFKNTGMSDIYQNGTFTPYFYDEEPPF